MAHGGPSKAILSVADKMATAIYHMIRNQVPFDPNTSDKLREKEKINLIKRLEKRLEKLKLAT
jgi:hypothetical protein